MAFLIFSIGTHFESVQGVSLGLLQQALVYHGPIEPLVDPSGPLHPDLTFLAG